MTLQDLWPRTIQENTKITLKIVSYVTQKTGLTMYAEDANEEIISLRLYNQVPNENELPQIQ